jgi:hypothetical protein
VVKAQGACLEIVLQRKLAEWQAKNQADQKLLNVLDAIVEEIARRLSVPRQAPKGQEWLPGQDSNLQHFG